MRRTREQLMRAHVRYAIASGAACGAAGAIAVMGSTQGDALVAFALLTAAGIAGALSLVAYDEARGGK